MRVPSTLPPSFGGWSPSRVYVAIVARLPSRVGFVFLAVVVFASASGGVQAQLFRPIPLRLALSPDGELAAVVAREGLFVPDKDGLWRMMCNAGLGVSTNGITGEAAWSSGQLLLATFRGLRLTDPTGCGVAPHDAGGLSEYSILSLDRVGDTLYALARLDGNYSLHVGQDLGADFRQQADLGSAVLMQLRVAPSQPDRIYFFGVDWNADAGVSTRLLVRSDDGGASRKAFELGLSGDREFRLLAVDPQDPDRLYASFAYRVAAHTHGDEPEADEPDLLLGSEDGGETFQILYEVSAFGGFALGSQPGELWLGSADQQLMHSTDYGATFTVASDALHVSCVERTGRRLWVCADSHDDPFSVGYSDDGGATFQGVMRFDRLAGTLTCDGQPQQACQKPLEDFRMWHPPADAADASSPVAGTAPPVEVDSEPGHHEDHPHGAHGQAQLGTDRRDAGTPPVPSRSSPVAGNGGGGCSILRPEITHGLSGSLAWLSAFLLWRRRRAALVRRS